jgi:hypothetical protein
MNVHCSVGNFASKRPEQKLFKYKNPSEKQQAETKHCFWHFRRTNIEYLHVNPIKYKCVKSVIYQLDGWRDDEMIKIRVGVSRISSKSRCICAASSTGCPWFGAKCGPVSSRWSSTWWEPRCGFCPATWKDTAFGCVDQCRKLEISLDYIYGNN